jgi:hydrogenase maturation factor HypF (carbamoyltransferase family)
MRERKNIRIRGLVQGVFFRDTVRRIAEEHHLDGFVRNVGTDALEIEAEGEADAVEAFIEDVRDHPPPHARVKDIRVTSVRPTAEDHGFYVERTAR